MRKTGAHCQGKRVLWERADVLIKSLKKKPDVNDPCSALPETEKQAEIHAASKILLTIADKCTLFIKGVYKPSAHVGNVLLCEVL